MQFQLAVSHLAPAMAEPLLEGLRRLGARVIEDRREDEEPRVHPLLPAPLALFISHEYLRGLQGPGAAERYRLLKWALGDAVAGAAGAPLPGRSGPAPVMAQPALSISFVFSRGELASFLFRAGLARRACEQALERMWTVVEGCARADDSLLIRARARLGSESWKILLRFDEGTGEWVPAGILGSETRNARGARLDPLPRA